MLLVRVHSSIKEIESLSMTEIFTSQILGKKEQQQKVLNLTFFQDKNFARNLASQTLAR